MQKQLPAFLLGGLIGIFAAVAPSCGPSTRCTVANCSGCCTKDGKCATGTGVSACGEGGHMCDVCTSFQACLAGVCTTGNSGNGGGNGTGGGNTSVGGGSGTGGAGGGGTTACGPSSCPDGCCSGGMCLRGTQQSNNTCGMGGFACLPCATGNTCMGGQCTGAVTCSAQNCPSGCCTNTNTCQPFAQQGPGSCGMMGGACATCPGGQTCSMGACVTPATVGGPCMTSAQCATLGAGAYCKLKTSTMNANYQNGYCTLPCTTYGAACGGGQGVCVGGMNSYISVYGEGDMFCAAGCAVPATQSTCRMGYICRPPPAGAAVAGYCWITPTPPFDGGGFPNKLGIACTVDGTCQNPPGPDWGYCIPPTDPNTGTPNGWSGGYCTADCSWDNTGQFCGVDGRCTAFNDGMGGLIGACMRTCPNPGGGRSATRPAYTCRTVNASDGGVQGILFPACDNAGAPACPPRTFCNAGNGYCCDGGVCLN